MDGGSGNKPGKPERLVNAMTVDVEDWFQVQAFAGFIERESWETRARRVEGNTEKILGMFADAGVKGTFFTLGWVAKRHPDLVRRIVAGGHELASHGYWHYPVHEQTANAFRQDLRRAKFALEDASGKSVAGYRAPTFSINARTPWAYGVLEEEGFRYSSSLFPIRHDNYGTPGAPRFPHRPGAGKLVEIPMTTVRAAWTNLPAAGGGYFRLVPYPVFRTALRWVNGWDEAPAVFYFHPWEIDPGQPRMKQAPRKAQFRHYNNLAKMQPRLVRLLGDFRWGRVDQVFAEALA